jgi:hypothetical protein
MLRRTALLAAVALTALALPATAAPKPKPVAACHVDPIRDVRLNATGPAVEAPHLDLALGDLATGRSTVTAAFRLWGNPDGVGVWKATFAAGKTRYYLVASTYPQAVPGDPDTAPGYRGGVVGGAAVAGSGVTDQAREEVRITVPAAMFGKAARVPKHLTAIAFEARATLVPQVAALVDRWSC